MDKLDQDSCTPVDVMDDEDRLDGLPEGTTKFYKATIRIIA